ncbi:MAG: 3-oxoacyl-ACP reductase FabG [Christensenellaceae bacterium]|nr:3-oxoacyl-ACP reductase FabG [Christensenellaceae bacterium]
MRKKRVLITGASGDIGTAASIQFASKNYELLLHYNSGSDRIKSLAETLRADGVDVSIFKADLTSLSDIHSLADSCGIVDVLINNAGTADTKLFTDLSDKDILSMVQTDLTSAMLLTKKILPQMLRRKNGKIINISSMWGITGASCEVVYSAAKAGLIGFTKALAKEVAPSGITVNCIAPGVIRTHMLDEYSPDTLSALADRTPLGRLGEPSEVAAMMMYLASMQADFITGQVFQINGGFVI